MLVSLFGISIACSFALRDQLAYRSYYATYCFLLMMAAACSMLWMGTKAGWIRGYSEGSPNAVVSADSPYAAPSGYVSFAETNISVGVPEVRAFKADTVENSSGQAISGKLGKLAHATQDRFWNPARGFDPANRETWNSQEAIIEWIKEQQPGISHVKAKAVEMIACPVDR